MASNLGKVLFKIVRERREMTSVNETNNDNGSDVASTLVLDIVTRLRWLRLVSVRDLVI
jgi:hypothetical protein